MFTQVKYSLLLNGAIEITTYVRQPQAPFMIILIDIDETPACGAYYSLN